MLLIYIPANTSRSNYAFELILKHELGIEYIVTTNRHAYERYGQEKLNYSPTPGNNEFFIKASTLLFEKAIEKINIAVEKKDDIPVLFPADESCDMGFDIFAATFYMVSRYEEYLPFTPDKHGRFKATDSLAYQNNFLEYPVVNMWIKHFKKKLSEKFPSLQFKSSSFKAIITYDIDIAYAFKGRSPLRHIGSTIKDIIGLRLKNINNRLQTAGQKKDPWDVYDTMEETIKKNNLETIFFFLLGDYSKYDKNISPDHPLLRELIKKISAFSDIGIHPSYNSSIIPKRILAEKTKLEEISNKKITKSRQHYLRFTLPDTYNHLLAAGITEEYSIGFADMPGFRAGTCTPFYFYDLKNEKQTTLKIFPVTFMEGTYMEYMKLSPSEALHSIYQLLTNIKNAEGTFICIWHNNTISDEGIYKGWKDVHDKMIEKISEIAKPF